MAEFGCKVTGCLNGESVLKNWVLLGYFKRGLAFRHMWGPISSLA